MLILVLMIMLAVSGLAVQGADSATLEWRMLEHQQGQQRLFESAEQALEQLSREWGGQSHHALVSLSDCGRHCVSPDCDQGLCFQGESAEDWAACQLHAGALPAPRQWPLWTSGAALATDSPSTGPSIRWLLEFRCYAPVDPALPLGADNATGHVRLTVMASDAEGVSRVMLRRGITLSMAGTGTVSGSRHLYWEQLDVGAY